MGVLLSVQETRRRRRRSARPARRRRGRGRRAGRPPPARGRRRGCPGSPRGTSAAWCPGMGTTPFASTQARASCGAVQPFARAISNTGRARLEVRLDVPGLEAGGLVPPVVGGEVRRGAEAAGQQPAAERAVGHEADAQLAAGGERARLVLAGEERVLALERADRVDGVGAAEGRRRGLGEAEEAHLARADQLGHGADGLLDRRLRVHPVLVVEVDRVEPEPLQARRRRRSARTPAGRSRRAPGGRSRARSRTSWPPRRASRRRPASALPTSSSFVCGP